MKLPSLQKMLNTAGITVKRFAITVFASTGATIIGIIMQQKGFAGDTRLMPLLMMFVLAIPLSLAFTLFNERLHSKPIFRILSGLGSIALVLILYLAGKNQTQTYQFTEFILFNIAAIMLVSVSPFLLGGNSNGFWQFNKTLLLRFLLSTFFSFILFFGLFLAIMALNNLFHTKIEIYRELWFITIGIFHTWFFLAGITNDYDSLDLATDYPRGLKIFTQFVLLPLVGIYLLILYTYLLKITITVQFPVGWVSYLVLGFSIAGLFSLLLIYPIQDDTENKWMRISSRWFFVALLPPVLLLFASIMRRISEYGFTQNRYFVLVLALWLAGISIYFAIQRFRQIIIIPSSLCIIAVLAATGPWGAFPVACRSQQKILNTWLQQNQMLREGKVQKSQTTFQTASQEQLSSVVDYLARTHGTASLQPLFNEDLKTLAKASKDEDADNRLSEEVHQLMGIRYIARSERSFRDENGFLNFNYRTAVQAAISVKGFDYQLPLSVRHWEEDGEMSKKESERDFPAEDDLFHVQWSGSGKVTLYSEQTGRIDFNLIPLLDTLHVLSTNELNEKSMSLEEENENMSAKLVFTLFSGRRKNQELHIRELDGMILVKRKAMTY